MPAPTLPPDPPPRPADEQGALLSFLDFYRTVMARKLEGLTSEQMNRTVAASTLTIGGLVKHLAQVEDTWLTVRFAGRPEPEPWASAPFDQDIDWDLDASADEPAALLALFDAACERSRAVVHAAPSLDAVSVPGIPPGRGPWNLRWILLHLIEEYARHSGHADLLREAIDGQVGD